MSVQIPLNTPVEDLSVASQQLVAIARALCHRSTVIIMDEPTSALTRREVRKLFEIVQRVRETGVTFIFVTHKLEEIYEITTVQDRFFEIKKMRRRWYEASR